MKKYISNLTLTNIQKIILLTCLIFLIYSLLLPNSALVGLPLLFPGITFYYSARFFDVESIKKVIYSSIPQILFFAYFYIDSIYLSSNNKVSLAPYALYESLSSLVVCIIFYTLKNTEFLRNNFYKSIALFIVVACVFFMSPILFWIGGLLVLPAIILFQSVKAFQGTKKFKILLGLLPWMLIPMLILLYSYIQGIGEMDQMIYIIASMILFSLSIGILVAFSKSSAQSQVTDKV